MWFVIGLVMVILLIAAVIAVAVARAQSRHMFSCPNCGGEFQPRWTQLIFEVHVMDEHRLTCPLCKTTGFCKDHGRCS